MSQVEETRGSLTLVFLWPSVSLEARESPRYPSDLYRSSPPICAGVTSEKVFGVGGSGKLLTKAF